MNTMDDVQDQLTEVERDMDAFFVRLKEQYGCTVAKKTMRTGKYGTIIVSIALPLRPE